MAEKLQKELMREYLIENSKLHSLIDIPDIFIVVLNREGKIVLANTKFSNLFGFGKDKIIGKDWAEEFFPVKVRNDIKNKFTEYINGSSTKYEEFVSTLLCKSGEEILVKWNNTSIRDEKDRVTYVVNFGIDITDSQKEKSVIEIIFNILQAVESEKDLNELFTFIHKSVGKIMPVENFYIALFNKENNIITFPYFVDKIDKVAPPKGSGKGLTEYVLRTGEPLLIDKIKNNQLVEKGEIEILGSQASIWLGVPLKIKDNTIGVLVVQDYNNAGSYNEKDKKILELLSFPISHAIERRRVEIEKNKLIEKLSELNASKDKLISIISHDLRSPFNSLLGFSEILTTEYDSLTRDEIQEYQKAIYDASKNLYNMTTNLLHYSRFQMGRFEYNPVNVKLINVINHSLNLLKGNALKKQLNLMAEIDNDLEVFVDEDMLSSILQNVISNAIKFTNKGGDVKVITNKISYDNKQFAEVIIQDNGIGIGKEDLDKINKDEIFSTPGTDREYGTGLGLVLVKEYVEKNGGFVRIHSMLNQGTTFSFALPLA